MSARIPRLPPSRIPQEFRVIESRLSRFSIRRSSRRSLRSINLSHYREFESVKHSSNLLFAFYWPPFDSFLLPFRSPCFSLFELKRKAVIPIYLSHCFFNVFNWHEDIEEESSLKRFVILYQRDERRKEISSTVPDICHYRPNLTIHVYPERAKGFLKFLLNSHHQFSKLADYRETRGT